MIQPTTVMGAVLRANKHVAVAYRSSFRVRSSNHVAPLQVECRGQVFYGCAESDEDRKALLLRIDLARRAKFVGDNGTNLILSAESKIDVPAEDTTKKVFSWGAGTLLGNGVQNQQGWALAQRILAFRASYVATGTCITWFYGLNNMFSCLQGGRRQNMRWAGARGGNRCGWKCALMGQQ
jgi:hypothetical protein